MDLTARVKILSDSLKHNAKIIYIKDSIKNESLPCLLLPFRFWEENEHFDLTGTFDFAGQGHFKLEMIVPLDLTIGIKRRSGIPTVSAFSTSPYISDIQIKSIKIVENKKWYDSGIVKFGAGVFTGIALIGLVN